MENLSLDQSYLDLNAIFIHIQNDESDTLDVYKNNIKYYNKFSREVNSLLLIFKNNLIDSLIKYYTNLFNTHNQSIDKFTQFNSKSKNTDKIIILIEIKDIIDNLIEIHNKSINEIKTTLNISNNNSKLRTFDSSIITKLTEIKKKVHDKISNMKSKITSNSSILISDIDKKVEEIKHLILIFQTNHDIYNLSKFNILLNNLKVKTYLNNSTPIYNKKITDEITSLLVNIISKIEKKNNIQRQPNLGESVETNIFASNIVSSGVNSRVNSTVNNSSKKQTNTFITKNNIKKGQRIKWLDMYGNEMFGIIDEDSINSDNKITIKKDGSTKLSKLIFIENKFILIQ